MSIAVQNIRVSCKAVSEQLPKMGDHELLVKISGAWRFNCFKSKNLLIIANHQPNMYLIKAVYKQTICRFEGNSVQGCIQGILCPCWPPGISQVLSFRASGYSYKPRNKETNQNEIIVKDTRGNGPPPKKKKTPTTTCSLYRELSSLLLIKLQWPDIIIVHSSSERLQFKSGVYH